MYDWERKAKQKFVESAEPSYEKFKGWRPPVPPLEKVTEATARKWFDEADDAYLLSVAQAFGDASGKISIRKWVSAMNAGKFPRPKGTK